MMRARHAQADEWRENTTAPRYHALEPWLREADRNAAQRKPAVTPPSTEMFCPVTHEDSSEAR